jgi:segregation and condensation protein B
VREEHDDLVAEFVGGQAPSRLSQAALETLAVIAYKQPVTRSQVAAIRAVNVDSVVRTLVARGLITELFTDPETGAINYGTTDALLVNLGSTRSTSCRTSRRCSTTAPTASTRGVR